MFISFLTSCSSSYLLPCASTPPSSLPPSSSPSPESLLNYLKANELLSFRLIQMDHPISFDHVGIGRLDPISIVSSDLAGSPSPSILPQPREGNGGNGAPKECRKGPSYSLEPGAAKFGDSPHSHVQIRQRASLLQAGDFTVELDFRTLYPNGLLFIIPVRNLLLYSDHSYLDLMLRALCVGEQNRIHHHTKAGD